MQKILVFLCLLLISKAKATLFTINNKTIEIPTPEGFVVVTAQMSAIYRFIRYLAPDDAELLACYIPKTDATIAKVGKLPKMERFFYILLNKKLKNQKINSQYFNDLVTITTKKINHRMSLTDETPENFIEKISKSINNDFNLNIKIKFLKQTSFPIHYKTENAFSYSIYNKYQITEENHKEDITEAKTTTTINIAGKILNLICEAPQKELEWTRNNSIAWSESIFKNNLLLLQQYSIDNTKNYWQKLWKTTKVNSPKTLAIVVTGLIIFIMAHVFARL